MKDQNSDHSTYREWLNLELDEALSPIQRKNLHDHLSICSECRQEQSELIALDEALVGSRVRVRPEFTREVMSGLPPAAWQARNPKSWVAALTAMVLLLAGSGVLIATAGEGLESVFTLAGVFAAIGDLFRSSIVVGAGLLDASWKGLGMAVREVLAGSIWSFLAVGVLVVALDMLLLRLLRKRTRFAVQSKPSDDRS